MKTLKPNDANWSGVPLAICQTIFPSNEGPNCLNAVAKELLNEATRNRDAAFAESDAAKKLDRARGLLVRSGHARVQAIRRRELADAALQVALAADNDKQIETARAELTAAASDVLTLSREVEIREKHSQDAEHACRQGREVAEGIAREEWIGKLRERAAAAHEKILNVLRTKEIQEALVEFAITSFLPDVVKYCIVLDVMPESRMPGPVGEREVVSAGDPRPGRKIAVGGLPSGG